MIISIGIMVLPIRFITYLCDYYTQYNFQVQYASTYGRVSFRSSELDSGMFSLTLNDKANEGGWWHGASFIISYIYVIIMVGV